MADRKHIPAVDGVRFVMDHPRNFPPLLLNYRAGDLDVLYERGQMLKALYSRLSPAEKKILLHPDVLPVFFGVKYFIVRDGMDFVGFWKKAMQNKALNETFSLMIGSNFIINYNYFLDRLQRGDGGFLIKMNVIDKGQEEFLLSDKTPEQEKVRFISETT